jgi:hypothetical protein
LPNSPPGGRPAGTKLSKLIDFSNNSMEKSQLPRWSAPVLGLIVGGACGLNGAWANPKVPVLLFGIGGILIGGLAGFIVSLLDPKPIDVQFSGSNANRSPVCQEKPSGVIGRFLAIVGLFFCWAPFLGLILNLVGFMVNRKSKDWCRYLSKLGLTVGSLATLATIVAKILGN